MTDGTLNGAPCQEYQPLWHEKVSEDKYASEDSRGYPKTSSPITFYLFCLVVAIATRLNYCQYMA